MTPVMLAGAALMLLGGAAAGLGLRRAQTERVRLLEELCAALAVMKSEIASLQTPLPELFSRLSHEGPPRLREFFAANAALAAEGRLSEGWTASAAALPAGERAYAALARLGLSLGRYDALRQCAELDTARESIAAAAETERTRLERRGRLLPGLGACLGAMLAILLL